MFVRALSTGLAVNRIAFGLGYLLKPAPTGRGWIGRIARHPGTAVFPARSAHATSRSGSARCARCGRVARARRAPGWPRTR